MAIGDAREGVKHGVSGAILVELENGSRKVRPVLQRDPIQAAIFAFHETPRRSPAEGSWQRKRMQHGIDKVVLSQSEYSARPSGVIRIAQGSRAIQDSIRALDQ